MLKSFAGGRLFGGGWGSGVPTVLALHGWRRTHQDFAPAFGSPEAESALSTIAPDLWGFGATPAPPEPWGSDEYARQLVPLFEEPGVLADRVVVVAHSFGGRVAARLWPLVPDRIERVVFCGVPFLDRQGRKSRPAATFRLMRSLHRAGLVGDERMEALRNRYGSADYRAATGVMRGVFVKLLAEQYADDLAAITNSVELLWGEEDTEVPVEVAVRARDLLPDGHLVTLPGIGHLLPTEAPDRLLQSVLAPTPRHPSPSSSGPVGMDPAAEGPRSGSA